ncbi:MAG: tetratricopeptide repeat protein [Lawsonibacter sp.]
MYRLGKELLKGETTKQDAAAAVEWFTRSAKGGNPYAQYLLGKLYLMGKEVPSDEEQAVLWLTRSAEQGNEYARYLLDHREEQRPPDVMLAVTRLLYHMSRIFQDNSLPKSRPGGIQIDRKRLRKLREKKIAQGHKPDDHEEQQPEMTM